MIHDIFRGGNISIIFLFSSNCDRNVEGEKAISSERAFSNELVKILTQKNLGQKDLTNIIDKLRKQETLTSDEFWSVYELLWQEGPSAKYPSTGCLLRVLKYL